jgi:HSP20 family molecular chaperone IbpA
MAEKTVPQYTRAKEALGREETRSQERYVTPPVDIYETPDGLVVLADLPGVAKNALDVRVENSLLTIRGKATHSAPGDVIYREYDLVSFFRQFELDEKVDQQKISAELKNGVLALNLPKADKAKPRRIDVRVA